MGHHVQDELGTSDEVAVARRTRTRATPNELSVRLELQADCYAGVWASTVYKQGDLQQGDLQEAFSASEAVGDDRLQRQASGNVNPDTFTHGTSEQRRHWFRPAIAPPTRPPATPSPPKASSPPAGAE